MGTATDLNDEAITEAGGGGEGLSRRHMLAGAAAGLAAAALHATPADAAPAQAAPAQAPAGGKTGIAGFAELLAPLLGGGGKTPAAPPPPTTTKPPATTKPPVTTGAVTTTGGAGANNSIWGRNLAQRGTYGATPAEQAAIVANPAAWIAAQVQPLTTVAENPEVVTKLRGLPMALAKPSSLYMELGPSKAHWTQFHDNAARLLLARYSTRQVWAKVAETFDDHFNTAGDTATLMFRPDLFWKVIYPYSMGPFGELLWRVAAHPGMLVYLDQWLSHKTRPNENFAREVLELHTIGVNAAYTEDDVKALAKFLTGMTIDFNTMEFKWEQTAHDTTAAKILGKTWAAPTTPANIITFFQELAMRPDTAKMVVRKLALKFIGDTATEATLAAAEKTYLANGGRIDKTVESLLLSKEMQTGTATTRFRRPFDLYAFLSRVLNLNVLPKLTPVVPADPKTWTDAQQKAAARTSLDAPTIIGCSQVQFVLLLCNHAFGTYILPTGFPDRVGAWVDAPGLSHRLYYSIYWALGYLPEIATFDPSALSGSKSSLAASKSGAQLVDPVAQVLLGRNSTVAERQGMGLEAPAIAKQYWDAAVNIAIAAYLSDPTIHWT